MNCHGKQMEFAKIHEKKLVRIEKMQIGCNV